MIFKTFDNDLTGLINKVGIFNKSIQNIGRDYKSGNGFFTSLFSRNTITQKDIQSINAFNLAMKSGSTTAQAWQDHMTGCTVAAKQQAKQCLVNKGNLSDLTSELNKSTFGAKAAAQALAIAGNMIAMWAISKSIELTAKAIDNFINSAKYASDKAQEVKEETAEALATDKETLSTLDELTKKYKELRESSDYDESARKEVLKIQDQITDLVGTQGKNLDLVNGKLDIQLAKLKELNVEQSKKTLTDAQNNYYSTRDAGNKLVGEQSTDGLLGTGLFSENGYDFVKDYGYYSVYDPDSEFMRLTKILGEAGYDDIVSGNDSFTGFEIKAKGDTAREKEKYLQGIIDVLRNAGETNNDLFRGVSSAIKQYSDADKESYQAAQSYLNTWLETSLSTDKKFKDPKITSIEDFEKYRKQILDTAKKDSTIADSIAYKDLNKEDLERTVDNYLSTHKDFSTWYEKWIVNVQGPRAKKQLLQTLGVSTDLWDRDRYNDLANQGFFEEDALDAFLTIKAKFTDGETEYWSAEDWKQHIWDELNENGSLGETDVSFNQAWSNLQNSQDDATKNLASDIFEVAQAGELTAEKLLELDSTNYFKNLGISATEAVDKINELVDASTQLSSLANNISKMSNLLASKNDGKVIDASELAGFNADVRGLESWKEFERLLGSSTSSMEDCQRAANALATEWINDGNFLANLNEQNKDYYITQLDSMGVLNSREIIEGKLAQKLQEESLALAYNTAAIKYNSDEKNKNNKITSDFSEISNGEIDALLNEQIISADTANALAILAVQKQIANGATLDTSADIQNLADLAGASTKLGELLTKLAWLKENYAAGKFAGMPTDAYMGQVKALQKEIDDMLGGGNHTAITVPLKINPKGSSSYNSSTASKKDEEKKEEKVDEFEKQYNWLEKLLNKLSKITDKWQKTSEKFFSWWKANAVIDKAIKSNRREIHANYDAVDYYQKKANKVGLSKKYRDLVENGDINVQDIKNEELADKIDRYTEWYEKIQDCKDAIEEAYDQERELIRQKLDNIMEYYGTIEQYYDSIASKFDAMTSLRESKGQKQSLADLLAEFQNAIDQSDNKQEMADAYKYEYNTSESAEYYQNQLDSINKNLEATAHYKKLLSDIAKLEAKQAKQEAKGKSLSKSDTKKLKQYYALRESLEANATAETIDNYTKIYNKWYKLQQEIDSGKKLSTNERKNYNAYTQQLDDYAKAKAEETTLLQNQVDEAITKMNGSSEKSATDAYEKTAQELRESYAKQMDDVDGGLEDSATYQKLVAKIDNKRAELDKLNAISEDKLTKKQKKRIETLQTELSVLEDQRNALDKGASADNVTEYLKIYQKWKKLDDKLKSGKPLTNAQTDNYDKWKAQLDSWTNAKQESIALLNAEMQDALEKLALEKQTQINENAAEVAEAQAKVYELAKQVAEFNANNIEQEIDLLDSLVSAAKSYIDLYQTMSKEKLIIAGVIDKDDTRSLTEIMESQYNDAIQSTNDKYKKLVAQQQEYQDLINAARNNDWDSLFSKYGDSNETVNKLKELLEENDWDGNTWVSEWETALANINQELIDCVNSNQELLDGLRENVYLAGIHDAITQLGYLQDTLSSITGLINDDWLFGEDGELTTYGTTKVGLLVEQMENAKEEASKYAEEINMITSMEDSYASDKAYKEALENAKKNYFNSLSELQGYQDSIVSIMRKSDEEIINSLKNVIEARKKALQKKKELYEYGKTINSSQKEIDAIQAQIDALESLSGAMDAATKAKLAQLKADLADKEEALQETKDEHTYNLQIEALDELLATLEDTMKGAADSVNKSFETYVQAINSAMDVYDANKDYLNDWTNSIISTITGLGGKSGSNTDMNLDITAPTGNNSAVQSLADGVLVRATDPLPIFNPEMMNYLQSYVPQMAINVNQTIPDFVRERNIQPVVNIHYDNLIHVEGNIDKDFAQVLPAYLAKSCEYTKRNIYSELSKLT